jgi:polygalacturonase
MSDMYLQRSRRRFAAGLLLLPCSAMLPKRSGWAMVVGAGAGRSAGVRISVSQAGAKGDGVSINTVTIQAAIDQCSRAGGGVVWFEPGIYVTGTVLLKDGVTLQVGEGVTLLGSLNPDDYKVVDAFVDGVNQVRGYALIGCMDVRRAGITGSGTIDGRGAELQKAAGKVPAAKPFLVRFVRSREIAVSGVKLINSGAWTMHLFQCEGAQIEGVSIRSVGVSNNDGIDVDSSRDIRIRGCTIETGDDAICLKTTSKLPCTDVTVTGCTLTTRCAAFKIGTETMGDFERIRFSDNKVHEARLGVVKLLTVDGAHLRDITVENIEVDQATTPIFLRLGERLKVFRQGDAAQPGGTLTNVVIRNVSVARASGVGIVISGVPGHAVRDVVMETIKIRLEGGLAKATDGAVEPEEKAAAYPEIRMFGNDLPASGMYARHVAGLRMTGVEISTSEPDARPAIVVSDAEDVRLADWALSGGGVRASVVLMRSVRRAEIAGFRVDGETKNFLKVEGAASKGIELKGVSMEHESEAIGFGSDADRGSAIESLAQQKR